MRKLSFLRLEHGESVTINIHPISSRKSRISSYVCCRNRFPCTFKFRHVPLKSNREPRQRNERAFTELNVSFALLVVCGGAHSDYIFR